MKLRVSQIALMSLLSVIPLAANDHDPDLLANDLMTVHPEAEVQESPDGNSNADANVVAIIESGERNRYGHINVNSDDASADVHVVKDEENPSDVNSSENDVTNETPDLPRKAQHEQIHTSSAMTTDGQQQDGSEGNGQDGNGNINGNVDRQENAAIASSNHVDGDANIPESQEGNQGQANGSIHSQENEASQNLIDRRAELETENGNETNEPNNSKEDGSSSSFSENDPSDNDEDADKNDSKIKSQAQSPNEGQGQEEEQNKPVMVDYANKSTGALILEKSPDFQGTSHLLVADKDKYAMIPCDKEGVKYVTIGLSEDILVKSIKLSSYEKFSSRTKRFEVLGSQTYPVMTEWEKLGTFDAKPWYKENKEQSFELERPSWARYLKFRFLDHYGDEHYCAYTQIKVHGSTTLQGFHEYQQEAMEEAQAEAEAEAKSLGGEGDAATANGHAAVQEYKHGDSPSESADVDNVNVNVNDANANQEREEDEISEQGESWKLIEETDESAGYRKTETGFSENVTGGSDKALEGDAQVPMKENISFGIKEDNANDGVEDDDSGGSPTSDSNLDARTAPETTAEVHQSGDAIETRESTDQSAPSDKSAPIENGNNKSAAPPEVDLSKHSDDSTVGKAPAAEEQSSAFSTTDEAESEESTEDESLLPSTSLVTDAVHSAINSVKKAALMKDAVKGIHLIIKAKTSGQHDASHENITKEAKNDQSSDEESTKFSSESEEQTEGPELEDGVAPIKSNNPEVRAEQGKSEDSKPEELPKEPIQTETSETNSNIVENNDTMARETFRETQEILSQLSIRFPSAVCLDYLDFAEWKRNKMESGNFKLKGSSTGEKQKQNEPIFVKLNDDIKGLEASQTVYEEYIQAATSCYQRVILDLGTELAVKEKEQEVRLSILEEQMRYLGEKEEKRELQAHLNDIILAIKTNFVTVVFPSLCSWGLYVNNVALELIERIMGNEYVQKFLVLIGTYQQFLFGFLICYIFLVLTKQSRTKAGENIDKRRSRRKQSHISATTKKDEGIMEVAGENRDKRRSRRKQSKISAMAKKNEGIMEVVISPSLQTDVEDDSL